VVLAICLAGGRSEDADCEAGVAGGRVGDPVELVVGDDILVDATNRYADLKALVDDAEE
jgi:hypothetical protein